MLTVPIFYPVVSALGFDPIWFGVIIVLVTQIGVITPPAEVADYYGVFIDPCRVGKSTDKGKVERLVPLARELFRLLKRLYPEADLGALNGHAGRWSGAVCGLGDKKGQRATER